MSKLDLRMLRIERLMPFAFLVLSVILAACSDGGGGGGGGGGEGVPGYCAG